MDEPHPDAAQYAAHSWSSYPGLSDLRPAGQERTYGTAGRKSCEGRVECWSTSSHLVEVVESVSGRFGPPYEVSDVTAKWRKRSGGSVSWVDAWSPGSGGRAPGFDPTAVPPSANCVLAVGSMTTGGPAQVTESRRRRLWRRRGR